ncbi:MAG: hypothetical protein GX434_12210 [Peptococcaceae bacterium]|nr:hypothetical protein [Peptococcaceae bacterium]
MSGTGNGQSMNLGMGTISVYIRYLVRYGCNCGEADSILVTIERKAFYFLGNPELGWACIEPTIKKIRGKNSTIKTQVYSELTKGQKALLMFRVLYDHARNSEEEFYSWINILLNEPHSWSEIKVGLRYFQDDSMLQFLDETESFLNKKNELLNNEHSQNRGISSLIYPNGEDFYSVFCKITQETINLIGTYIRNNPEEFVRFID